MIYYFRIDLKVLYKLKITLMYFYDILPSLIGDLLIVSSENGLKQINFCNPKSQFTIADAWIKDSYKLRIVTEQLNEYFNKTLSEFELDLAPDGTAFQKQIWKQLQKIPYGETKSYLDIANAIGKPNACRAVGMANSSNPIPIIIPCHRVIGKNGKLTGYAGGLEIKAKLLELENISLSPNTKQYQLF